MTATQAPNLDLRVNYNKNYFINGDMSLSERNVTFAGVTTGTYTLDRMIYNKTGAMVHTITQDTTVPTFQQAGYLFTNSLRMNLTTPDTSIAAGDFCQIGQIIEGYNWRNLAQKTFTLSFWVMATLPGTYCVSFINAGSDRSYVAEYVINNASTWEYKTITVSASPAAGTWDYVNGSGLRVRWALACGSTFQTTADTWQTGNFFATANQVNGVNTGASDFRLTGIMINEGAEAMPFRLFGTDTEAERQAAQRYFEKSYSNGQFGGSTASAGYIARSGSATTMRQSAEYKTMKRAGASVQIWSVVLGTPGNISKDVSGNIAASAGGDRYGFTTEFVMTAGDVRAYWHFYADAELS